jgi:hypothetical protein
MELLSITEVSARHEVSRNTVAYAVFKKYLPSIRNLRNEHLIKEEDADFYFDGPEFPLWWSYKQIASLGIPITLLYTLKDRYAFDYHIWKKNLYAYIPGNRGIEKILKELVFLVNAKPMIKMERPPIE